MIRIMTTEQYYRLKADAAELHHIRRFAKRQDRKMDDVAHDGRDARPPTGDDWNDLFHRVIANDPS